jgi:NADH:ubiquinone oxidoreductase subunit 3 (subunit A)
MTDIDLSPIVTFIVALIVIYILYLIAGRLGPKFKDTNYKTNNYACGEEHPKGITHQSYDFFHVAFFFTVLHVGALLIATAPSDEGAIIGVLLIGSVALTAFALFVGGVKRA